jgi:hypothetical protein
LPVIGHRVHAYFGVETLYIEGLRIELTNLPYALISIKLRTCFFKEGNSSLWQREARRDFSKGL